MQFGTYPASPHVLAKLIFFNNVVHSVRIVLLIADYLDEWRIEIVVAAACTRSKSTQFQGRQITD